MEDVTNELDKTNEPRKESDINLDAERYKIHARRNKFEGWTEWSHVNTIEEAFEQADKIVSFGWKFKIFDKKTKEIIHKND